MRLSASSRFPAYARSAALALALIGASAATPARAQTLAPAQRVQIEGVVKDYLLAHPEVIRDALIELQKRDKADEAAQRAKIVGDMSGKLYASPYQSVVGNPNGKIKLVEFFDYNCGFCKHALDDLVKLMKAEPELQVILKDFPVLGQKSVEAAQVAIAARAQLKGAKLFDYHQRLLSMRGQVGRAQALAVAKEMGLDMAKLAADMDSDTIKTAITETLQLGDSLNITGTPSYVVNKEVLVGAVGFDELKTQVDAAAKVAK